MLLVNDACRINQIIQLEIKIINITFKIYTHLKILLIQICHLL